MPLAPIRAGYSSTAGTLGERSTMIDLKFSENETSLNKIDRQSFEADVRHEVQTTVDPISKFLTHVDLGNALSRWENITEKREPRRITQNIDPLQPKAQTFDQYGMFAQRYGDECWLPSLQINKSTIRFKKAHVTAMMYGFERLKTRCALAAMVNPVRMRNTVPSIASSNTEELVELDNGRIVGFITKEADKIIGKADATGWGLANPTIELLQKLQRLFTNHNVSPTLYPIILCTPNVMELLTLMRDNRNKAVYNDAEDISHGQIDWERKGSFQWRGFNWVKCTPEVSLGAFYSGKVLGKRPYNYKPRLTSGSGEFTGQDFANTGVHLANAGAKGTTDAGFTLDADNHEVCPIWIPQNVIKVTDHGRDVSSMVRIPHYRNELIYYMEMNMGGSRVQNLLQVNVVFPKI